jgi:hypothetical protein
MKKPAQRARTSALGSYVTGHGVFPRSFPTLLSSTAAGRRPRGSPCPRPPARRLHSTLQRRRSSLASEGEGASATELAHPNRAAWIRRARAGRSEAIRTIFYSDCQLPSGHDPGADSGGAPNGRQRGLPARPLDILVECRGPHRPQRDGRPRRDGHHDRVRFAPDAPGTSLDGRHGRVGS